MGTRSTVKFYSEFTKTPIVCVYHQFDGYYKGVGKTLAEFLKDKIILNGYCNETMENGYANGLGCLAAQYIKSQKKDIGEFYITNLEDTQEYNYEVILSENKLIIKEEGFTGTPEEFLEFLKSL